MAIVLNGPAASAWKAGSPQLVTTTLQQGQTNSGHIHILSGYVPTFSASRVEKDQFLNDLQQVLDSIPSRESYVRLGDFNARVGSRTSGDDWSVNVRGPHRLEETNDAEKELLSFMSLNRTMICNTWFKKKDMHKSTWPHPKSKKWHYID